MALVLSRRTFLLVAATAAPLLAACGGPAVTPAAAPTATSGDRTILAVTTRSAVPGGATPALPAPRATVAAAKSAVATRAAVANGEPGSPEAPLRMAFVPSQDSQKVLASGKPLADLLEKETGLTFDVSVPTSYAAVIEAMGANRLDIGWLAPFSYVIAHQKFEVRVILSSVRNGSKTYPAQIIVPADSTIDTLDDLRGKRFAFVDSTSASGYLYPAALIKEKGGEPATFFSQVVYAGGHDKVVIAVYNRNVEGGATFGNSANSSESNDARTLVKASLPDVMTKVKVIGVTDPIPNDTVSVRKGLPEATMTRVQQGLLEVAKGDAGKKVLGDLYRIDGLAAATDGDYDLLRRKAQLLGFSFEETIRAAPTPTPKP